MRRAPQGPAFFILEDSDLKPVRFSTVIRKEDINPYVDPPLGTGGKLGRHGVVPVRVSLDGISFRANLMPLGAKRTKAPPGKQHRLYLHGTMRKTIGKDVGDRVRVELKLDTIPRVEPMNPTLFRMLRDDLKARKAFESLSPSHRKELNRYLNHLKSREALQRNVDKVMRYLRQSRATWFGKQKS